MSDGIYDAVLHIGAGGDPDPAQRRRRRGRREVGVAGALPARPHGSSRVEVEAGGADEVEAFRAFLDSVSAEDFEDEDPSQ